MCGFSLRETKIIRFPANRKLNLKDSRKAALTITEGVWGMKYSPFSINLSMLLVFQRFEILLHAHYKNNAKFSSADKDTPVARSYGARSFCLL